MPSSDIAFVMSRQPWVHRVRPGRSRNTSSAARGSRHDTAARQQQPSAKGEYIDPWVDVETLGRNQSTPTMTAHDEPNNQPGSPRSSPPSCKTRDSSFGPSATSTRQTTPDVGDESSKVTVAANNMRDIKDALENMQRLQAITNEELRDSKGKIAMLENTVQQLLKSSEEKKKEDEEQNEMQDEEQGNNQNNQQHGALKDTQIQVYFPNYTLKRMVANLADTHLWVYLRVWNFVSTQQVLGPQSHHDGQHESTAASKASSVPKTVSVSASGPSLPDEVKSSAVDKSDANTAEKPQTCIKGDFQGAAASNTKTDADQTDVQVKEADMAKCTEPSKPASVPDVSDRKEEAASAATAPSDSKPDKDKPYPPKQRATLPGFDELLKKTAPANPAAAAKKDQPAGHHGFSRYAEPTTAFPKSAAPSSKATFAPVTASAPSTPSSTKSNTSSGNSSSQVSTPLTLGWAVTPTMSPKGRVSVACKSSPPTPPRGSGTSTRFDFSELKFILEQCLLPPQPIRISPFRKVFATPSRVTVAAPPEDTDMDTDEDTSVAAISPSPAPMAPAPRLVTMSAYCQAKVSRKEAPSQKDTAESGRTGRTRIYKKKPKHPRRTALEGQSTHPAPPHVAGKKHTRDAAEAEDDFIPGRQKAIMAPA